MFLLDDLLLSPVKGLMAIGRHIQEAAQQELDDQEKAIVASLSELHRLYESGGIGDEEFNAREGRLLDRLEEMQGTSSAADETDETDDQEILLPGSSPPSAASQPRAGQTG